MATATPNVPGIIALQAGTGGSGSGGTKITIGAFNTSGNVVVAAGPGLTQVDTDIAIAAVAGDKIGLTISCVPLDTGAELVLDAATRVTGADVNYLSSGGAAPRFPGALPEWLQTTIGAGVFPTLFGEVVYVVQAGDLAAGTVTLRPYGAGDGGARTVERNANFPLRCVLKNYGQ